MFCCLRECQVGHVTHIRKRSEGRRAEEQTQVKITLQNFRRRSRPRNSQSSRPICSVSLAPVCLALSSIGIVKNPPPPPPITGAPPSSRGKPSINPPTKTPLSLSSLLTSPTAALASATKRSLSLSIPSHLSTAPFKFTVMISATAASPCCALRSATMLTISCTTSL